MSNELLNQKQDLLNQLDQLESALAQLEALEQQKQAISANADALRQRKQQQQADYDALLSEALKMYQSEQLAQDVITNQVQELHQQIKDLQNQYDAHAKAKATIVASVKAKYVELKSIPYSLEGNSHLKQYLIKLGFSDIAIINYVCR